MRDIEIEGLGRSRLTLVQDGDATYVMASMPNDKAENETTVAVVALDQAGFALLKRFVMEVNE